MSTRVNADNFVRAETDRMFAGLQRDAGGINVVSHNRSPASVDHQTVIRMNRDTLYSFAVVDITAGATLTIPEHGGRYLSAMVVNQDHYINEIFHLPGEHQLTMDRHRTPFVALAVRTLVDPTDPDDLAEVHALQDGVALEAGPPSRSPGPTTTGPASTPPDPPSSPWPVASPPSTAPSAHRPRSTRSATSSAPPPDGAGCRPPRRPTSA